MSKTVQLKNGVATIDDFIRRKTMRELVLSNNEIEGAKKSEGEKGLTLAVFDSDETLVANMLSSLTIDGVDVGISREAVGNLHQSDFEKLTKACVEVLTEFNESKKKETKESKE